MKENPSDDKNHLNTDQSIKFIYEFNKALIWNKKISKIL